MLVYCIQPKIALLHFNILLSLKNAIPFEHFDVLCWITQQFSDNFCNRRIPNQGSLTVYFLAIDLKVTKNERALPVPHEIKCEIHVWHLINFIFIKRVSSTIIRVRISNPNGSVFINVYILHPLIGCQKNKATQTTPFKWMRWYKIPLHSFEHILNQKEKQLTDFYWSILWCCVRTRVTYEIMIRCLRYCCNTFKEKYRGESSSFWFPSI